MWVRQRARIAERVEITRRGYTAGCGSTTSPPRLSSTSPNAPPAEHPPTSPSPPPACTAKSLSRMSTDLILDLVRQNLAVALLSPAVTPADPQLRAIPVSNSPTRTEYLAWSDFNPSPAAQAFLELLRSGPA